jgi:cytochrome c6
MAATQRRSILLLIIALAVALYVGPRLVDAQNATPSASPVAGTPIALVSEGQKIFETVCLACHQAGGKGIDGIYPALDGNVLVNLDDPKVMTTTVLYGRGGMPRFNTLLNSEQLAAVISYVRSELGGNHASPVTAEYVDQIRAETEAVLTVTPEPAASDGQDPAAGTPAA